MLKRHGVGLTVLMTGLTLGTGHAQQQQPEQSERPMVAPIELYACNYREGQGMDEFLNAAQRWNGWADGQNVTDYTALVMTPVFYSDELTADVLWLGAWPNGQSMGTGLAAWLAPQARPVEQAFADVVDCDTHMSMAAVNVRPPQGQPQNGGIAMFRNCSLNEGRIVGDAFAALTEWTDYLAQHDMDIPTWVAFPLAGERGDAEYDFKVISGFDSARGLGAATELYIAGGGVQRANEIFDRVMSCDSPRIYVINPVRLPAS